MQGNSTNQQARCILNKFSSPTVPFSLLDKGATLNLHTHTHTHLYMYTGWTWCQNICDSTKSIFILQIASSYRRNHDHYSIAFTCSSTYTLLCDGARIVQNNTVAKSTWHLYCMISPADNWSIELKRWQVIFQTQVGTRSEEVGYGWTLLIKKVRSSLIDFSYLNN